MLVRILSTYQVWYSYCCGCPRVLLLCFGFPVSFRLALGRSLFIYIVFSFVCQISGEGRTHLFISFAVCFFFSFLSLSFFPSLHCGLSCLLHSQCSISLSRFCDHRACTYLSTSINILRSRRNNRHGHWVCSMSTGRKNGLINNVKNAHIRYRN